MERKEISVVDIFQSVKDGQIGIDKVWHEYGDAIKQFHARDTNESLALLNLYIRYCGHLHQSGYWKDEGLHLDLAHQVLISLQGFLSHEQYEKRSETILSKKAYVSMKLGDYAMAIKILKELLYKYPSKDSYKNMYINALRSKFNKFLRPMTIILCLICLAWIVLRYLLDGIVFPYWILVVIWGVWMLMYVVVLLIPTYVKRFAIKAP